MRILLACCLWLSACGVNDLGAQCQVAVKSASETGTAIARDHPACASGLCLLVPSQTNVAACTRSCDGDDDCHANDRFSCAAGYACAIAVQVGSECCRKLCICRDDLVPGFNSDEAGQVVTPLACDAARNPRLTCPNLLDPKL